MCRILSRLFLCWLALAVSHLLHASQPNLLIITVDDMSCDSVGVFGSKLKDTTPNMDRLAASAMRFEYAHVQVGNCMPSRNVMWSGRYPHNNRVEGFYQVKDAEYPVLADLMKQAGYFTAIRHKVSHSTPYSPYAWDLVLDKLADGSDANVKNPGSYGQATREGIQAAKQAGRPFCLIMNVADPHKPFYSEIKGKSPSDDPYQPSKVFTATEVSVPGFLPDDAVIRQELSRYYSSVRRADDGVGEVLRALDESEYRDDTIVLFLSDHGMPLPFAKTQLYHHSTHTPLMIRWPGVTQPGTIDSQHMVSAVDLLPTILDVLKLPQPEGMDGRSFASLLQGKKQPDREFVIKEYNENAGGFRNPMRAIQTRNYLYIFNPWSDGKRTMATATNGTDTYRRMQRLARSDAGINTRVDLADHRVVEEFYHVSEDPDCLRNLIADPAYRRDLEQLQNSLVSHMQQSKDPLASVFEKRKDPIVLAKFMREQEADAAARKKGRNPVKDGDAENPSSTNSRTGPTDLIELLVPNAFDRSGVEVQVKYALPIALDKQTLLVTLKSGDDQRIERKTIEIEGTGLVRVQFAIPAGLKTKKLRVAALLGKNIKASLQHVQSELITLKP